MELGCGVGFLGIVVAALQRGQGEVWLSDVSEEVLAKCMKNLQLPCSRMFCDPTRLQRIKCVASDLSSTHPSVHCKTLDWSLALQTDKTRLQHMLSNEIRGEIVIGADIVCPTAVANARFRTHLYTHYRYSIRPWSHHWLLLFAKR